MEENIPVMIGVDLLKRERQKMKGNDGTGNIEENHSHAKRYFTRAEKWRLEGLKDKHNS